MIKHFFIVLFILSFFSCDSGFDKSLISETDKLTSPDGKYTLYTYDISSPMAFGSGFTVVNILKSDEVCDVTDEDILRFGNDHPFSIKWNDDRTLTIKCLMDDSRLSKHQPIKKDVVKWKDWIFNVEYYSVYSTGIESSFLFDNYSINGKEIKFKSKNDSLVFDRKEVQFSLEGNHIHADEFKIATFDDKLGLSFAYYDLTPKGSCSYKNLQTEQPFIRTKL